MKIKILAVLAVVTVIVVSMFMREKREDPGLTKKSPPKKKFSLSADMRELLCIFRLPNQCKYT